MKIYETKHGYFYKEYKNGKKVRISQKEYLKSKTLHKKSKIKKKSNIKKKPKIKKKSNIKKKSKIKKKSNIKKKKKIRIQKGGNRELLKLHCIAFFTGVIGPEIKGQYESILDGLGQQRKTQIYNMRIRALECIKNLLDSKPRLFSVLPQYVLNSDGRLILDPKSAYSEDSIVSQDLKLRDKREVGIRTKYQETIKKFVATMRFQYTFLRVVLKQGSVWSDFNTRANQNIRANQTTSIEDVVLVDAAGYFLKEGIPEKATSSSKPLYQFLGLTIPGNTPTKTSVFVKQKYQDLEMGIVLPRIEYDFEDSKKVTVIHAYSYNFHEPQYASLDKWKCVRMLANVYKRVFEEFIESRKKVLHLLPLSGKVFAGKFKDKIQYYTKYALNLAFSQLDETNQSKLESCEIKLCLYRTDELLDYMVTHLYQSTQTESANNNAAREPPREPEPVNNTAHRLEVANNATRQSLREPSFISFNMLTNKGIVPLKIDQLDPTGFKTALDVLEALTQKYIEAFLKFNTNSQTAKLRLPPLHPDNPGCFVAAQTTKFNTPSLQESNYITVMAIMNALSLLYHHHQTVDLNAFLSKLEVCLVSDSEVMKALFTKALDYHLRFKMFHVRGDYCEKQNLKKLSELPAKNQYAYFTPVICDPEGSVGVLKFLQKNPEIKCGMLVAGNSGVPGGMHGRNFDRGWDFNAEIGNEHQVGQEESIVASWLKWESKAKSVSARFIFNHTIRGKWGMSIVSKAKWRMLPPNEILEQSREDYNMMKYTNDEKHETLQGIDYRTATPELYQQAWLCKDCEFDSTVKADLVFVAGPNIAATKRDNLSTTTRTLNTHMQDEVNKIFRQYSKSKNNDKDSAFKTKIINKRFCKRYQI